MLVDEVWRQLATTHGITLDTPRDPAVDVLLRVPGWDQPVPYEVKVFTDPVPPTALAKIHARHRQRAAASRLLLVVPTAPETLLTAAVERGVSVLRGPRRTDDPVEGILLGAGGERARLGGEPDPARGARRRGRTPWATYAVAFGLLSAGAIPGTQRQLAAQFHISQPRVSQILAVLRPVAGPSLSSAQVDRDALAQWLVQQYPRDPRVVTRWMTLDPPIQTVDAVHLHLNRAGIEHAVSGQVAADCLAPWDRPQSLWVWARSALDMTDIPAAHVSSQDATLTVAVADDPYLLASARQLPGHDAPVLAPWRVWVDLVHQGHDAAADVLRQALLKGKVR